MSSIFIKNMVCNRCIMVVQNELEKLNLDVQSVGLGRVDLNTPINKEEMQKLEKALVSLGFELIDDRKSKINESIKNTIIDLVHQQEDQIKVNLSDLLSSKLKLDYGYLSSLFSQVE